MKEVNDPGSGGSDLREHLRKGGSPRTWNNVARWAHGIKNRKSLPDWSEYENISLDYRKEMLKSICAFNIKKESGGSSAKWGELETAAMRDQKHIKNQYALYKPDITFCCSKIVTNLFSKIFGFEDSVWRRTGRGVWYCQMKSGEYVVQVNHPQQRSIRSSLLFYELVDAVNEIL